MKEIDKNLLYSSTQGELITIKDLIAQGDDPSIKDANGDSPISWTSWHLRSNEFLALLLYGDVPGWHGNPNPNLNGKDFI